MRDDSFAILALVVQFCLSPCHGPRRSLGAKYALTHIGLPLGPTRNVESHLYAIMEEYHLGYFQFWLIFGFAKTPLWGPQFQPPMWSIGGAISLCP